MHEYELKRDHRLSRKDERRERKVRVGGGAHVRDEVHEGVADERADGERDERLLEVVVEAHVREPHDREHREQAAHADHHDGRRAAEQRAPDEQPVLLRLLLVLVRLRAVVTAARSCSSPRTSLRCMCVPVTTRLIRQLRARSCH